MVSSTLGPPLLLFPAAVALTSNQAFREAHIAPEHHAAVASEEQIVEAEPAGSTAGSAGSSAYEEVTEAGSGGEPKKEL